MIKNVTVFGFSECGEKDAEYQAAYQTAKFLAEKGYHIINGGGPGIMRAATKGAHDGGGKVTTIPFIPTNMTNFEGRDPENIPDVEIVKPNYVERTLELLDKGDAYVIFNGGTGTISEFGMAWGLARLYFGVHKPLILYGSWWHQIMETFAQNMRIREIELQVYRIATTPEEVVRDLEELSGSVR